MLNRKSSIQILRNDYNDLNMCTPVRAEKGRHEEIKASICAGEQGNTEGYLLLFMSSLSLTLAILEVVFLFYCFIFLLIVPVVTNFLKP